MRISELSRTTGVPVATVKYYLREGLLPPGLQTSATQATYGEHHVERLRLIRALVEVGGLSIAAVRDVLGCLDDEGHTLHRALGAAHGALPPHADQGVDSTPARELVDALGWRVHDSAPALRQLARAMSALEAVGMPLDRLETYAQAAHAVAEADVATVPGASRAEAVRNAVVGTVLYEPVLLALRRLAQEDVSARWFGAG
ncbi:MAG TPA: MerR family transcriptional regulator [Actinomycetales bacterium]|nr:MerR family transcriptional regulator [Actinomycetales bacterium]